MNSYARRFESDIRDAARLAELRAEDQRTPGEIAENAAAMAEIEAA